MLEGWFRPKLDKSQRAAEYSLLFFVKKECKIFHTTNQADIEYRWE